MTEFFAMGGYGAYIWPAYLIAATVMVGLLVQSVHVLRRRERTLDRLRAELRGGTEDGL